MYTSESEPLLPKSLPATSYRPSAENPLTELYGYAFMLLSSIFFSSMTFLVHVSEKYFHYPVAGTFFLRGLVTLLFSLIYFLFSRNARKGLQTLTRPQVFFIMLRGVSGSCGVIAIFSALKRLPMGEATSLFFVNPIFTLILSVVLLSEPIAPLDIFASIATFIGVILVMQPHFNISSSVVEPISYHDRTIGSLMALLGAVLASVAYITIRYLGTNVHFIINVSSIGFFLSFFGLFYVRPILSQMMAFGKPLLFIFLAALAGVFGQVSLTLGLQRCRAGPGVLMRNVDVPASYILGILFLRETTHWVRLFGSVLILSSAIAIGLRQAFRLREKAENERR